MANYKIVFILSIAIFISLSVLLSSCGKNNFNSGPEVITVTNDEGVVLSDDPADWKCSGSGFAANSENSNPKVIPSKFCLNPAYPNPCYISTTVSFDLPVSARINIFITNQETDIIFYYENVYEAGVHEIEWNVTDVEPGFYRCYITAGNWSSFGDIQVVKHNDE